MTKTDIFKKISECVQKVLNVPFSMSSNIKALGFDELDEVELLIDIERTFDIRIEIEDFNKIKTIGDYVDKVKRILDNDSARMD